MILKESGRYGLTVSKMDTLSNLGHSRNNIALQTGDKRVYETSGGFPSIHPEVPPFFSPQHRNSSVRGPFFDPVRVEHDRNRLRAEQ